MLNCETAAVGKRVDVPVSCTHPHLPLLSSCLGSASLERIWISGNPPPLYLIHHTLKDPVPTSLLQGAEYYIVSVHFFLQIQFKEFSACIHKPVKISVICITIPS